MGKHLRSIVRITDLHVVFEVANAFDMLPLVHGFQSCHGNDWVALATCPDINTDWRIASYILFAEWAWNTMIRGAHASSNAGAAATGSVTAPQISA